MTRLYKLLAREAWEQALGVGVFHGSAADLADGYIHFSTAAQLQETARRHFAGRQDLVVLEVEDHDLGPALKWEVSRGEQLFPHLFAPLQTSLVLSAEAFVADPAEEPA